VFEPRGSAAPPRTGPDVPLAGYGGSPRATAAPPADDPPTVPLPTRPGATTSDRRPPPGRRPGRLAALARRWVPEGWRGARTDPGRPGAVALVVVAAVAAVLAAVGVWSQRPRVEPVGALPAVSVAPTAGESGSGQPVATPAATPTAPPEPLVVSVAGKVVRPGLVRVPDGARVADVLEAAGGPLPGTDLSGLNLARRVGDGEQVAVGVPAAPDAAGTDPGAGAGPPGGAAGADPAGGVVDLNAATLQQLDGLPGVGPVTAQRILDWRERNGRFAAVEQLREVEGIGERRFEQMRELVRV
jgi:competence protein ComEA